MSRIGRTPITIPAGVEVKVDENNHVTFQRVLVAEKNSLGMPKFMDAGIAFNRVMN